MNGIAIIPIIAVIIYAFSNPTRSPKLPIISRANALTRKLIVINIPLIKAGCSVSIEFTSASSTGVAANIIKPISISIGNTKIVLLSIKKIIIRIGVDIPITSRVVFLPIWSEIVPENNVPAAPENWTIESAIPPNHKVSPFEVKKVGKNVVNDPLTNEVKKKIPLMVINIPIFSFIASIAPVSFCLFLNASEIGIFLNLKNSRAEAIKPKGSNL